MSTQTTAPIPKKQWRKYFNDIGRQFEDWSVTVQVLSKTLGDDYIIEGLPFQGISYEPPQSSQPDDILVEAGDQGSPYQTHLIHHPRTVMATMSEPGEEMDIEIETRDKVKHLISLRRGLALPAPQKTAARKSPSRRKSVAQRKPVARTRNARTTKPRTKSRKRK
jgi:hypothetical protein